MTRPGKVFQFRISLRFIAPEIWRRIQLPYSATFWDLHVAIQDAMGWQDQHMHVFRLPADHPGHFTEVGLPGDDGFWEAEAVLPGWEIKLSQHFRLPGARATYEYDFGDGWELEIELEATPPREKGIKYPLCLSGERACPPEDCGGVPGYADLLQALKKPKSREARDVATWLGRSFDPEAFSPDSVRFTNPKKRLALLTSED